MAKKKAPPSKVKKIPRQDRLPGMADAKIQSLHDAALDYAEIRDKRQELTKSEVELKDRLMKLMHKYKKTVYDYNGVHIELVVEEESVKVRVRDPDAPAPKKKSKPEQSRVESESVPDAEPASEPAVAEGDEDEGHEEELEE
jgi:hypothetical protein